MPPPWQDKDHISLLEEALSLANIHGQIHSEVYVLSPGILYRILTQHREEDIMVQMGLVSHLGIASHSNDASTWTIPGHLVSTPARLVEHNNGPLQHLKDTSKAAASVESLVMCARRRNSSNNCE
ncbi:hypothetical protein HispidOSU_013466 [Sigmodon hispidus]